MTTRLKPLFYETAKCVALYMNANVRNNRGGLQMDVDVYGLPMYKTENMRDDNEEVEILEREIMWLRKDLQNKKRGSYETFKQILSEIEEAQSKLKVRQNRINISPSSCRNYLQLTVITGEVFEIERVDYKKQFKLTREYIEKRIFSNMNIQVGNLEIGGYCKENDLQLPLEPLFRNAPQGDFVKPLLSIREGCLELGVLKVTGNLTNALASLQPVLSATVPLKQLRTVNQSFPNNPIIKTSQLVLIVGYLPFTVLSSYPNNRTHIEATTCILNNEFANVVNKWMESNISVGTYYSIGDNNARFVEEMLAMFRKHPGAESGENKETRSTKFPECIIIPMKNYTELNVYYCVPNKEEKEYCNSEFIVKIKWQPRGYARVIEWD